MAAKKAKKNLSKTTKKIVPMKKTMPISKPKISVDGLFTKKQIASYLANAASITKTQIDQVLDNLGNLIHKHISNSKIAEFIMPGLFKIKVIRKAATKARKGVNPFTGQEQMFKAKPARNIVKIKALKKLKDMVK